MKTAVSKTTSFKTTVTHHPDDAMLTEYATGSLSFSTAVSVSAHISYCESCRKTVREMEALGGDLLESLKAEPINEDCFDNILKKIDTECQPLPTVFRQQPINDQIADTSAGNSDELPSVVQKLIPKNKPMQWKRLGLSLHSSPLKKLEENRDVSLHRIKAGSSIFEHDHYGEEITLVLQGSFSDVDGIYQPGDFIVKKPGDVHSPLIAKNADCICLVVEEAPVKFTGFFTRCLNLLQKK